MSIEAFFTADYVTSPESFTENLHNLVEGYFDLSSGPALLTALKIASYVTLILPAAALAIKLYLRCFSGHLRIEKLQSFSRIHPEFSGLLQKMQNLVQFDDVGVRNDVNSRHFRIGSDAAGQNQVFIKYPVGKHVFIRQERAKNEQLAFLISHRLDLGVVPPTMALEGSANEIEAVFPKSVWKNAKLGWDPKTHENSYAGVIVQEGVSLEQNPSPPASWDRTQVQKAIIFNFITGRFDAGSNNTVVCQSGKIMELDNERLGFSMTDSWLISEFSEMTFDAAMIDDLLSKPANAVENVFEEMRAFRFGDDVKTTIVAKFEKIRGFFTSHRENQTVRVKDLADYFET